MKLKLIAGLAIAALSLSCLGACRYDSHRPHYRSTEDERTVYHFNDGRWGYYGAGAWYYYYPIYMGAPSTTYYTSPTYTTGGVWQKASTPPTKEELDEATHEEAQVQIDENGDPVATPEEVQEDETIQTEAAHEAINTATEPNEAPGGQTETPTTEGGGGETTGGGDTGGGGGDAGGGAGGTE